MVITYYFMKSTISRIKIISCFLSIVSLLICINIVHAEEQQTVNSQQLLVVGTKAAPPFSMKTADGKWTGLSIDLWRQIAAELNLQYEFRERTLEQMLDGVVDGSLYAAVAALTITPEREQKFDFTHSYYTTGIGIAITSKTNNSWLTTARQLFSPAFLKVLGTMMLLLLGIGLLMWFFEHKKNPHHFHTNAVKGIGSGFWWSAVTLTTVGYGDKAPITLAGRILGLIWMFIGIIMISSFTAAITSSLTVSQLETAVKGPDDLPKVTVGTIADSTSASYLKQRRISFSLFESPQDGLAALEKEEIQAFIYDAPILRYYIQQIGSNALEVLPHLIDSEVYGIALQPNSPMRKQIDVVLLQKIQEEAWHDKLQQYLGK